MNRLHILIILIAATVFVACKTSEANYRAAYERAAEQRQAQSGVDSTIYARIRNQATTTRLIASGDSIPMRTEYVSPTKDEGATRENTLKYNVVVGQFKQIFNARQMRQRLISGGYPDARLLETREPLYYVVTATCATPEEAEQAYRKVLQDKNLVLRAPLPFILRPAQLVR